MRDPMALKTVSDMKQ